LVVTDITLSLPMAAALLDGFAIAGGSPGKEPGAWMYLFPLFVIDSKQGTLWLPKPSPATGGSRSGEPE
jgi:hypothetical protein